MAWCRSAAAPLALALWLSLGPASALHGGFVQPWNGLVAIEGLPGDACIWKNITATAASVAYPMCLRDRDTVSDVIRSQGSWKECDELLTEWRKVATHPEGSFFVDAGANIGSCTLLMANQGIPSRSFEPSASNLYYFTHSLLRSEVALSNTKVYPVGLGESHAVHVLYSQPGNQGNSVVGRAVGDADSLNDEMKKHAQTVYIDSLDDVLWPLAHQPPPMVPVMKIDVQGFEVQLLKGASRLLAVRCVGLFAG